MESMLKGSKNVGSAEEIASFRRAEVENTLELILTKTKEFLVEPKAPTYEHPRMGKEILTK